MDALLLDAETQAAEAATRVRLIRDLSVNGIPADVRPAWEMLWAVFRCGRPAPDQNIALGVCFNLLLVHRRARPGFLIMRCEVAESDAHARAMAVAERHFAVVGCAVGSVICLPAERERVAARLARGSVEGKLDTAVGQVLGYSYAGEMRDYHKQSNRFAITIRIEQSTENGISIGPVRAPPHVQLHRLASSGPPVGPGIAWPCLVRTNEQPPSACVHAAHVC